MLKGLLSVGAEGQVQLVVQWLHHSYKVSQRSKRNPTPLTLLCETLRLPAIVPTYQIAYFWYYRTQGKLYAFLELKASSRVRQNVLTRAPSISTHVMAA